MPRTSRLFEIIQILRAASRPVTAEALAARLEVSARTIYRDLAALQSMRVPVQGEAGIGYVMRRGYDLPPLNFDEEEVEALRVGLSMLARAGDGALTRAAARIAAEIDALNDPADWIQVAPWGAPPDDAARGCVQVADLRAAIRGERKLRLVYQRHDGARSERVVRPVAMVYHLECVMLAAWCELRGAFRHFRCDRMHECALLDERFAGQGAILREIWLSLDPMVDFAPAARGPEAAGAIPPFPAP